jgi:hypothetical protein
VRRAVWLREFMPPNVAACDMATASWCAPPLDAFRIPCRNDDSLCTALYRTIRLTDNVRP